MSPLSRVVPLMVLALVALQGCSNIAVLTALHPRYAASVEMTLPPVETLQAVRRALVTLGWQPLAHRSRGNRIVAVRDVTTATRDVAIVDVGSSGQLELWVRTEIAGDDGHWIVPATICDGYSYAREREIVDRVETTVRRIARRRTRRADPALARNRTDQ